MPDSVRPVLPGGRLSRGPGAGAGAAPGGSALPGVRLGANGHRDVRGGRGEPRARTGAGRADAPGTAMSIRVGRSVPLRLGQAGTRTEEGEGRPGGPSQVSRTATTGL